MTPAAAPPARARAPIGSTPELRARLSRQRPRPLLVRLYAATLGEGGVAGPRARRNARRFVLGSLPAVVAVAVGALVARRTFETMLGWTQAAVLAALALALAGTVWRRGRRAAAGERATWREQLEIGSLMLVAAYAMAQTAGGGQAESPFQAIVYLVMAFLVAFLARRVGFALVLLAVAIEVLLWLAGGAIPWEIPAVVVHASFVTVFAVLYHAALASRIASARRLERAAVQRRLRDISERARELRLLAPGAGPEAEPGERQRRWTQAAVVEIEAAMRGALEIAEVALRSHTVAVFLLSPDDRELRLRECRSASEAVTREPLPAGEGPIGGAVRSRAPIRLHGDVKAPSYYANGTTPGALLVVPLVDRRGGHVRGVVVADRLEPVPFGEEDERLLATMSAEILRAVAAERLMIDMKRERDEKERFYDAIERLNRTTTPLEVFDATLDVARGMVPVDFGAVTLVEEVDGKTVHRVARVLVADAGRPGARLEGLEFADDSGLVASAVRLGSSLPGRDIDVGRAPVFDPATRLKGLASLKVIPLRTGQKVLGAVVLGARRAGAYGQEAVRQLEVVAMQAAESIYRARLFEQTERLATTDGLTGLTNHRTFQVRLEEHVAQARRYGKRLSLILCDIDHFKAVNDTYGHPVGDVVLKGVARTLLGEARETDVVARYGGEEFAVVMPETDAAGALVIAERIRKRVKELAFRTERGPLSVTLSLGIASFPDDAAEKAELVERADACLYHAKRNGRDRSVSAASLRAAPPARLPRASPAAPHPPEPSRP